jgi:hypothetical protein
VDYAGLVDFEFVASGLKDAAFFDSYRGLTMVPRLLEAEIRLTRRFAATELRDHQLEIAMDCQRELYWTFGFDAPQACIKSDFHIADRD